MQNLGLAIQQIIATMKMNMPFVTMLIAGLWVIHLINRMLGMRLNILGIVPRNIFGFPGIIFSPFLHSDFNHLLFNSIPLFILANLVLLDGRIIFYSVSTIIILLGGLGIWLFGRRAIHVGASGLIMGYFGYLVVRIYHHPTIVMLILGVVFLYYFGVSFLMAFMPTEKRVSLIGHVCGLLAGIAAAFLIPMLF